MTIPNRRILMRPVLGIILNEAKSRTECARQIADEFNLTAAQRAQLVPNGRLTRIQDTVDWAIVDIVKAGYAVRPRRGYVVATQQGRGFYAGEVSNNVRNREVGNNVPERTPSECIEEAYAEMKSALRDDLLDAVLNSSPEFFERLILDLMHAMKYGDPNTGQHLGRSGDGGVDGSISQDPLGLDVVYLQAKRWDKGMVGSGAIRDFVGALDERGAVKGVFITTSDFAKPAREAAQRSTKHVRLIDGTELTNLLIEYNVGVINIGQPVYIKNIDGNYFSELRAAEA